MVHIHYTQGPVVLSDVSKEVYDSIVTRLAEKYSFHDICIELNVTEGVVNTIQDIVQSGLKRCCFCGALFNPSGRVRANTCGQVHYLPCIDCGELVKVKESYANYTKAGGRRCSKCRVKQIGSTRRNKSEDEKKAIVDKQQSTMLERYGAKVPLQVPELKAKIQATVKERYGVDNLSQSKEIQDKIKKNSQDKFGVDHYSNDPRIRQRMIDGMISKYGVMYAQQNKDIQEKTKQTNLERYGCENVFQNDVIKQRFVDNHTAKYGVSWPHQRPELIEQIKQSNIRKYGAVMKPLSDEYMKNFISDPDKFDNYKSFLKDPKEFINNHYSVKPSVKQICEDTGVTDTTIYARLIFSGMRDLATEFMYSMEVQLSEFILSLNPNLSIQKHNRSILNGKEIDLFIPSLNIGFECNPTYTHNSSFQDPWGAPPKDYRYHAMKSSLALESGVFVYHVFGYEWTHRRELIQSQIRNLIGANKHVVYARKTKVQTIDNSTAIKFLNDNHRQGSAQSKVRLGLVDDTSGELVSLMTFGRMRPGIGKKADNIEDDWELIRFCNKVNTSVVGGASKLFKHFVTNYNPHKIVSFSDIAHTRGNLYSILGFEKVSVSDPGYVWVNLVTDNYYNRVSCQKANLPKLFDDVTEQDIQNMTEIQIMLNHGYAQVFDSGVIRWEYVAENTQHV